MTVRIGTRTSRLALWQAGRVAELLRRARPDAEVRIVELSTRGDEVGDRALPDIGGEGVFTERIERALRDGSIDVAVHSLKDLPVESRDGLVVAAVLDRSEVREALIARRGASLASLPAGAVVGSSSTRRQAQLLAVRSDLVVRPIRGNVETRIAKIEAGQYDATLLAGAGLARLGLEEKVTEWMSLIDFLPAPGQGALAVQCRADNQALRTVLRSLDDPAVHAATDAERTFLGLLGCGCAAPVAALAEAWQREWRPEQGPLWLSMRARVSALDGRHAVDVRGDGADPQALAEELVRKAREAGADAILRDAGRQKVRPSSGSQGAGKPAGALRGLRVMVTRAAAQAGGLCGMLESRGATPIAAPMVHVERLPPTDALREVVLHLGSYDWIIFTSVNGVDSFFDAVGEIAGTREAALAGPGGRPMIAAVGPSTADALTRRGAAARFVPAVHSAAALAAGLGADAASGIAGARILFPRAETAREEAVTILHQRGAFVEDIPFYRTKSAEISETDLAAIRGGVDAILFMSGSAVHAFCDRTETEPVLAAAARHALVACLGPSTADAARERGLTVSVMPEEHTAGALVESLERHFSRGNGGPS